MNKSWSKEMNSLPICPLTDKPCLMNKHCSITEINNGEVKSINLCHLCAQGYIDKVKNKTKPKPLNDGLHIVGPIIELPTLEEKILNPKKAFKTIIELLGNQSNKINKPSLIKRCPGCDSTLQDIAATQRLGCPTCYDCFGKELESLLKNVQKVDEVKHIGKVPKNWKKRQAIKEQGSIVFLEAKMKKAVEEENYDEAAKLRDRIKELKKTDPNERIE